MAKQNTVTTQKGKLLGDLYYNDVERVYVPPPIAERKALMQSKEDDYIRAVNEQNALDKFKRNLPKQYSPDIYNNILAKIDAGLEGVTPDTYSDRVLDVAQLSNDVVNKFGGAELIEQQKKVQEAAGVIDKAVEKGDIVDPALASWKKSQIKTEPLAVDANGFVTKPTVSIPKVAPYQNIPKFLDDTLKGWAEDGTFKKDPVSGRIIITRDIPGYLTYGKETSISEDELRKSAMQLVENDGKVKSYLDDLVDYQTKDIKPTAENLATILSQEERDHVTGIKDSQIGDLQQAINSGLNAEGIIKVKERERVKQNQVEPFAQKYGFLKEEIVPMTDILLKGSLDAELGIAKAKAAAKAKAKEPDTAIITLEPFTTQRILNPTDIEVIQTNKAKLVQDRKAMQVSLNMYKKGVTNKEPGYTQERLDEINRQQDELDRKVQQLDEQELGLQKLMVANGKKAGVDINQEAKDIRPYITNLTNKENTKTLLSSIFTGGGYKTGTVDITDEIKDGKYRYNPGLGNNNPSDRNGAKNVDELIKQGLATKTEDGRILLDISDKSNSYLRGMSSLLFTETGELSSKVALVGDSKQQQAVKDKLYKVPSMADYRNDFIELYNKGEDASTWYGADKEFTTINGHIIPNKTLQSVEKVRAKQGEFQWELSTPLSYLTVTGESLKSATKVYANYEKALNKDFKTTPEQYNVNVAGKLQGLGDYLKQEYGIPSLSKDWIDWDKTKAMTLVESDRVYGQNYGITIALTKEGREELNDKGLDVFKNGNNIKVTGVNPNKRYDAQIRDQMVRSYPHLLADKSEQALDMKHQMGIVYLNNSQEGKDLDALNLYTMAAGDSKSWKVKDTEYQINTTTRDANEKDDMNVDFNLSKSEGGKQMVLAVNSKGVKEWKPALGIDKDKEWNKVIFETPTDIKAAVGGVLLENAVIGEDGEDLNIPNPYADYMKTIGYDIKPNQVLSKEYGKVVKTTQDFYGKTNQNITIINQNTQQPVQILARVGEENLQNLADLYPDRIKTGENGVAYPYVNKQAVPYVGVALSRYPNLLITGGLRGESTHQFGKKAEASEDSLHKYGFALDYRDNEDANKLLQDVQANPEIANELGILSIKKHGDPVHIHVEFNPNLL